MLKILNCKILVILLIACSAFAGTEKPVLQYEFWQEKEGIKIQSCLSGHNVKEVQWLLPFLIESLEVVTDTRKQITSKYDYIETNYQGKTCIKYKLENHKGWHNYGYFQDISEDSFLIIGKRHSLIIPESILKNYKNINVKFNWHNFPKQIDSNFNQASNEPLSLTFKDFDSLYYVMGYEILYADSEKKNKFIYPQGYSMLVDEIKPKLTIINAYLEKHLPSTNIDYNTFIFVENQFQMSGNPGTAYSNDKEFLQLVGVNKKQTLDIELIRTFIHEYLHKMIGCAVQFDPRRHNKESWFKEGFVDYLSAKILLDTNIWSIENYIDFYNSRIYKYFALEMDKYKLQDLYNKYVYEEAHYTAGMLYASKLDNFIISHTAGSNDLMGFLRMFCSHFIKNKKLDFSEELFFESLKSFIKKPFPNIEELRKSNSLLSDGLLFGKIYLTKKEMQVPTYSCNFYELISTMTFNDKKVISMLSKANEPWIHHLELIDKDKKIEYVVLKPSYVTKFIPQYEARPPST